MPGPAPVTIAETARLRLRRMTEDDAGFMLALVTDRDWLRFIGDRGVTDLESTLAYMRKGPLALYDRLGFGFYAVEDRTGGTVLGISGLVKRDGLDDVDLGFAFLPPWRGRGLARESAEAVLRHAREDLGLGRLAAITDPENTASIRLLERLDFIFLEQRSLTEGAKPVRIFHKDLL